MVNLVLTDESHKTLGGLLEAVAEALEKYINATPPPGKCQPWAAWRAQATEALAMLKPIQNVGLVLNKSREVFGPGYQYGQYYGHGSDRR